MLQVLAILKTAYPNTRLDAESTFTLWYSEFGQEDFAVARQATSIVIKQDKDFFPTIGRFSKAIERAKILINTPEPKLLSANDYQERKRAQELVDWVIEEFFPNY